MHLSIFSSQKPLFVGEVKSLTLPGSVAPFQVLKKHASLISTLEEGVLMYQPIKGSSVSISIQEGIVKVKDDTITVLIENSTSLEVAARGAS